LLWYLNVYVRLVTVATVSCFAKIIIFSHFCLLSKFVDVQYIAVQIFITTNLVVSRFHHFHHNIRG